MLVKLLYTRTPFTDKDGVRHNNFVEVPFGGRINPDTGKLMAGEKYDKVYRFRPIKPSEPDSDHVCVVTDLDHLAMLCASGGYEIVPPAEPQAEFQPDPPPTPEVAPEGAAKEVVEAVAAKNARAAKEYEAAVKKARAEFDVTFKAQLEAYDNELATIDAVKAKGADIAAGRKKAEETWQARMLKAAEKRRKEAKDNKLDNRKPGQDFIAANVNEA